MFNLFKRATPALTKDAGPHSADKLATQRPVVPVLSDPVPVPAAIEGNDNADWALWEESVSFQDSQFESLLAPENGMQKAQSGAGQEVDFTDAFASVHKKAP